MKEPSHSPIRGTWCVSRVASLLAAAGIFGVACSSSSSNGNPGTTNPDASTPTDDGGEPGSSSGSVSGDSGGTGDSGSDGDVNPGGQYLVPNPLISRGKSILASPANNALSAFDGSYSAGDGVWATNTGAGDGTIADSWIKINIGAGPTKLLLTWWNGDVPDYTITPAMNYNVPTAYTIDVSADGNTWKNVVTVAPADNVTVRARGHAFDFTGMTWVRYSVTKVVSTVGSAQARIAEIDVYDVSKGNDDTWLITGAGPSRVAYSGWHGPLFPELVHNAHAAYYPAMLGIADTGPSVTDLLANIDKWLTLNDGYKNWVLVYGLFDTKTTPIADFSAKMQQAIDKLKGAGKRVLVPRIQFVTAAACAARTDAIDCTKIDAFNGAIDDLVTKNALFASADLHAWFSAHPDQLCKTGECETDWIGIEASPLAGSGIATLHQQWAQALDPHYSK